MSVMFLAKTRKGFGRLIIASAARKRVFKFLTPKKKRFNISWT